MTPMECDAMEWHQRTFGPDSALDGSATFRKLCEEVGELGEAMMQQDQDAILDEAGDVALVLLNLVRIRTGTGSLLPLLKASLLKCLDREREANG